MSDNGVQIIDRGWNQYKKTIKELNGISILFGFFAGVNSWMAMVAHRNEYGAVQTLTKKQKGYLKSKGLDVGDQIIIPPRSFIRSSFDENTDAISERAGRAMDEITRGGSKRKALDGLAKFCTSLIHRKLDSGNFAPNDPFTREQKGASKKPLEDKGALQEGIDSKVML